MFDHFVPKEKTESEIVTISKRSGVIYFNTYSTKRYHLRDFKYASFLWDEGRRVIGILRCKENEDGTKFRIGLARNTGYVCGYSFFSWIEYDEYKKGSLRYYPFLEDGLICIDLNCPIKK